VTNGSFWRSWHNDYDDPDSDLADRLVAVQARMRAAVDVSAPGPIRVISACATADASDGIDRQNEFGRFERIEGRNPMATLRIVRPEDRAIPPEGQTPGLRRETAVAEEGVWIGVVHADPGVGGWHHHSENDTYVYMLDGVMRIEQRDGRAAIDGKRDDFLLIPRKTVHREITPEGEHASAIIIRVGSGPAVVNVE